MIWCLSGGLGLSPCKHATPEAQKTNRIWGLGLTQSMFCLHYLLFRLRACYVFLPLKHCMYSVFYVWLVLYPTTILYSPPRPHSQLLTISRLEIWGWGPPIPESRVISEGGMIRLETLFEHTFVNSSFLRVDPLIEIGQIVSCRAIRGNSISVNSTLPPLSISTSNALKKFKAQGSGCDWRIRLRSRACTHRQITNAYV